MLLCLFFNMGQTGVEFMPELWGKTYLFHQRLGLAQQHGNIPHVWNELLDDLNLTVLEIKSNGCDFLL